jgi:hypothetical protein
MNTELELPYFKFSAQQYLLGDIALEEANVQGAFTMAMAQLKQRLSKNVAELTRLVEVGIIKHDPESDLITIEFLYEQRSDFLDIHETRVNAGRKGGKQKLSKALAKT